VDDDATTVERFVGWYIARCVREHGRKPAPKTIATKVSRLRSASRYAQQPVSVMLRTTFTSRAEWEILLAKLYANLEPGTVGNVVSTCRDFAAWAIDAGIIDESAIRDRDAPTQARVKPHELYTPEQVADLVVAARAVRGAGRRFSGLLLVVSETACRVGEALSLEWSQVHAHADPPHAILGQTKSGTQQYLALSDLVVKELFVDDVLRDEVGNYRRDGARYVFPWAYPSVRTMLLRLCERVGVPALGFHAFRHTKATALLANGVPINAVAGLLRHSSVAITERYYDHTSALTYAHYLND
jgi:integrase